MTSRFEPIVVLGLLLTATLAAADAKLPKDFAIKPGQEVLLFGDSIIGPGMYAYTANAILDKAYPHHGITFHCWGKAMASTESILPAVPEVFGKHFRHKRFDWVLLNFGNNGRFSNEDLRDKHAPALIAAIRRFHKGRIAWLSVLGMEPSPYAGDKGGQRRSRRAMEIRARQKERVAALREICRRHDVLYLPLHEGMDRLLQERREKGCKLCFTMDGVHPNTLGNWLAGALVLQSLGLRTAPLTVDVLSCDAFSDQGHRNPPLPKESVLLEFESLFLSVRLVPPPTRTVKASVNPRPVKVDGKTPEWDGIRAHHIRPPLHVTWELVPRSRGYAASLQACRDARDLYLLVRVQEPSTGPHTDFQEIVEVFIDARRDRSRSGNVWRRTKGLTQFVFARDFTGRTPNNVRALANGDKSQGKELRAVAVKTADGYLVEAAIPLANFTQVPLQEKGGTVPLDWAVSFTDQCINLDWMGLMSRSQNTFGYGSLEVSPPPEQTAREP